MQVHPTLLPKRAVRTLAEKLAAGELTATTDEVAVWLKVSRPTVIACIRAGTLPGRQVGRQFRVSVPELAEMWGLNDTVSGGGPDVA